MAGQGSDQAFGGISFAAPAPPVGASAPIKFEQPGQNLVTTPAPSSESSTPAPPNVKLLISSLHAKISVHYSSSHRQHSHHK